MRINVDLAVSDLAEDERTEGDRAGQELAGVDEAARHAPQDLLSEVVDYEAVATRVRMIVSAGHVGLVETLAERIAERTGIECGCGVIG